MYRLCGCVRDTGVIEVVTEIASLLREVSCATCDTHTHTHTHTQDC